MKELRVKIAKLQQECPPILKETDGYGYKYASLPQILEVINPIMKKLKMGFTQLVNDGYIETIIFDLESEDKVVSNIRIPEGVNLKGMNQFQVLGSAITYLRRYALSSMLGIVTDVDNDAAGEETKSKNTKPWLNLTTKDGKPTKTYEKLMEANEKTPFTLKQIQAKYKVSAATKELLSNDFKIK